MRNKAFFMSFNGRFSCRKDKTYRPFYKLFTAVHNKVSTLATTMFFEKHGNIDRYCGHRGVAATDRLVGLFYPQAIQRLCFFPADCRPVSLWRRYGRPGAHGPGAEFGQCSGSMHSNHWQSRQSRYGCLQGLWRVVLPLSMVSWLSLWPGLIILGAMGVVPPAATVYFLSLLSFATFLLAIFSAMAGDKLAIAEVEQSI
jgi:hypothetical protein